MPDTTPDLGLPFPQQGDAIDVAADIESLARAIEDGGQSPGGHATLVSAYRIFPTRAVRDAEWPDPPYGALAFVGDAVLPVLGQPAAAGLTMWDSTQWVTFLQVTAERTTLVGGQAVQMDSPYDYQDRDDVGASITTAEGIRVGVLPQNAQGNLFLPTWSSTGSSRVNVVAAQSGTAPDINRLMPDPGSSERVKTDIEDLTLDEAKALLAARIVKFKYRWESWRESAGGGVEIGLIAEDIGAIDERTIGKMVPFIYDDQGEIRTEEVSAQVSTQSGELVTRTYRQPLRQGSAELPYKVQYDRLVAPLLLMVRDLYEIVGDIQEAIGA